MQTTTRAVVVNKFGGYDVLSVKQIELPPLEDKIEIKTEYAGLNFADLYTRQGLMPQKTLPLVLGIECTGVISAIGNEEITNLKVGQRVICYDFNGGLYAETIRTTKDKIYPLPDHVSLEKGAAIFVNYLTAYFALIELGNLKENQNVLILSCAGGIGWASTQLAHTVSGVKIYGICSPVGKEEECKKNGVDFIISYDKFKETIPTLCPDGFDVIISNQSGDFFLYLQTLLKPLGRIVCIGANNLIENEQKLSLFSLLKAWWANKNIPLGDLVVNNQVIAGLHLGALAEKNPGVVRQALKYIFELIEQNKITPRIHSIQAMSNVVEATKILALRRNIGKVVISIKE